MQYHVCICQAVAETLPSSIQCVYIQYSPVSILYHLTKQKKPLNKTEHLISMA